MDAERLLEGLNEAQRGAVTTAAAPLCILAGAGSGKTRVLTRRIAHRVAESDAEPHRVLALTFTRKAAGELKSRLAQLGLRDAIAAGTFHGIALAQLRARWSERGDREPQLLDRKVAFVARLLPRRRGKGDVNPLDAVAEIEWAKARRIRPDQYADEAMQHNRRPPMPAREMAALYQHYQDEMARQGRVDFDDLLDRCEQALVSDPAFAATQRWRFRHLFVDEFQDVNPLQFALLRAWLGDRTDLCVVGDPRQAIYAWNGADATYLNHFDRHFPGSEVLELRDNYRSTPQILAVANAVIGNRETGAPLRPNRPNGEPPEVVEYPTDAHEARGIARAVRDAHGPGRPWADQAVLARTNAQAALIADALGRGGIPHRVKGGAALTAQPEVKAALQRLKAARVPFTVALADLQADTTGRFDADDDEMPQDPATSRIPRATEPSGDAAAPGPDAAQQSDSGRGTDDVGAGEQERRANLAALVQLGADYLGLDSSATANGFISWLNAAARSEEAAGAGDAVDVATFHAAKGLEWPIVHVAGVEAGLVPIGHARSPEAEAEERRLFYVALTRAERVLRCSWATQRTFGTRVADRRPSPYLAVFRDTLDAMAAGQEPVDGLVEVRKERRRLQAGDGLIKRSAAPRRDRALTPGDLAVLDALKAWRLDAARAASVPAYVIFPDKTLEAVAATRPRDIAALLALPGVGRVKATRYGDTLLAVVADHASAPAT